MIWNFHPFTKEQVSGHPWQNEIFCHSGRCQYAIECSVHVGLSHGELQARPGCRCGQHTMPWPPKVLVHPTGIKNKPLFPKFLRDHKNSDGGLRRRPTRYEAPQTHIPHEPGITLRCPFEYRVSMRSNSSFARDHEANLANEAIPGAKPSKLPNPKQSRGQRHLPSSHLGRVGKRDPPWG